MRKRLPLRVAFERLTLSAWLVAVAGINAADSPLSLPAPSPVPPQLPGDLDPTFGPAPGLNSVPRIALPQPDHKVILGGYFTSLNGVARGGIARLNSDGSSDTNFNTGVGADNNVFSVALQNNGSILVGGEFQNINETPLSRLGRLLPDGVVDTNFVPSQFDGPVWAIQPENDGRIVVGGDFGDIGGVPRFGVARLHSTGTVDVAFAPVLGTNFYVRSIAVQPDGKVLAAGTTNDFNSGLTIGRVIRFNTDGGIDPSFSSLAMANGWIYSMARQTNGGILVAGLFSQFSGVARQYLVRLESNGVPDPNFGPDFTANGPIYSVAVQSDGKILIAGDFTRVNGQPRGHLARLLVDGTLDATFQTDPGAGGAIESVTVQNDGAILIAGNFFAYNNTPRSFVARLIGNDPVPFAPVFLEQPASQTVNEGANVTFAARVRAFPFASLQWQFNDTNLPGATFPMLAVPNVRPTGAGNYTLIASNALGVVPSTIAMLTVIPAPTTPGSPVIDFYTGSGANNVVYSVAPLADNSAIIGGIFASVNGITRDGLARLNSDGSVDPFFAPSAGVGISIGYTVRSVVAQMNGGILLGGGFTTINGLPRRGIARLLNNGNLDPMFDPGTGADSLVMAVAAQNAGKVVIGGFFSSVNGTPRSRIARLNSNGSVDTNFNPGLGVSGIVYAVAVQGDGRVLIAGEFYQVDGVSRNSIARLNADGSLDLTFETGTGANNLVRAIALQSNGRILIGGAFTRFNGVPRNRIARLDSNGRIDDTFEPADGPDFPLQTLALQSDGKILIGGNFQTVQNMARSGVARLNPDGSLDLNFTPGTGTEGQYVYSIGVRPDGNILIGGNFYTINQVPRPNIALLRGGDAPASSPMILIPPADQSVAAGQDAAFSVVANALPPPTYQWQFGNQDVPDGNNWLVRLRNVRTANAGLYAVAVSNPLGFLLSPTATLTVNPSPRLPGSPDIDYYSGLGPNGRVNAVIARPDGSAFIAGAFTEVDGIPRRGVAKLTSLGHVDLGFDPLLGTDREVRAMAVQSDGRIVLGGDFESFDGTPRPRLARLHPNGSLDSSFAPAASNSVYAIDLQADGKLLVGGLFTMIGDALRIFVARLETNGAVDPGFTPSPLINGLVFSVKSQPDGKVLIGGTFGAIDGQPRARVARLNTNGTLDLNFNTSLAANNPVRALALQSDSKVLIGGDFNFVGGAPRAGLARLDTNGFNDITFTPGSAVSNSVMAIALQDDGRIWAGGTFTSTNGMPPNRLVRLNTNGLLDASFQSGSGVTGGTSFLTEYGTFRDQTVVNGLAIQRDGRLLLGGDFGEVDGVTRYNIARIFDEAPSGLIQARAVPTPGGGFNVLVSWQTGTLQQAVNITGPWADVPDAVSPHLIGPAFTHRFFRLRLN